MAEPPVTVVNEVAKKHGTLEVAQAYLTYLYSPIGQSLVAKHYYRPALPKLANPQDVARFPEVKTFTVDEKFGGWNKVQEIHFKDGGIFDQIYQPQ